MLTVGIVMTVVSFFLVGGYWKEGKRREALGLPVNNLQEFCGPVGAIGTFVGILLIILGLVGC